MATEFQTKIRSYWAWRKRGDAQWLPMPKDHLGIQEMYTLLGLFYFLVVCDKSVFQELLESDLHDVFFSLDDFAQPGEYTNVESLVYMIPGIYNYPYENVSPDVSIGVQSTSPVFKVQESDIVGVVKKGDKLKICQGRFTIIEAKPDGVGCLDLILHKEV